MITEQNYLLNEMVAWEEGTISEVDTILLFAALIKTKMAWKLQGCYGREAVSFIENEIIDKKGNILVDIDSIVW